MEPRVVFFAVLMCTVFTRETESKPLYKEAHKLQKRDAKALQENVALLRVKRNKRNVEFPVNLILPDNDKHVRQKKVVKRDVEQAYDIHISTPLKALRRDKRPNENLLDSLYLRTKRDASDVKLERVKREKRDLKSADAALNRVKRTKREVKEADRALKREKRIKRHSEDKPLQRMKRNKRNAKNSKHLHAMRDAKRDKRHLKNVKVHHNPHSHIAPFHQRMKRKKRNFVHSENHLSKKYNTHVKRSKDMGGHLHKKHDKNIRRVENTLKELQRLKRMRRQITEDVDREIKHLKQIENNFKRKLVRAKRDNAIAKKKKKMIGIQ